MSANSPDWDGNERRHTVRRSADITPDSHVKITLYLFVIILIGVIGSAVGIGVAVTKFSTRLDLMQNAIENSYTWSDHTEFTVKLAQDNPTIKVPITVHQWRRDIMATMNTK